MIITHLFHSPRPMVKCMRHAMFENPRVYIRIHCDSLVFSGWKSQTIFMEKEIGKGVRNRVSKIELIAVGDLTVTKYK